MVVLSVLCGEESEWSLDQAAGTKVWLIELAARAGHVAVLGHHWVGQIAD